MFQLPKKLILYFYSLYRDIRKKKYFWNCTIIICRNGHPLNDLNIITKDMNFLENDKPLASLRQNPASPKLSTTLQKIVTSIFVKLT